jgi:hypothetical protein
VTMRKKYPLVTWLLGRARHILYLSRRHQLREKNPRLLNKTSSPPLLLQAPLLLHQKGQGLKRSLSLPLNWVALLLRSWMM